MIAVFVLAIGLLGAAGMQLSALKYTDSSRMNSQASFIVYDIIDRIRANADPVQLPQYAIASLAAVPGAAASIRDQDLIDFARNLNSLPSPEARIAVNGTQVAVTVSWSEARAAGNDEAGQASMGSFSVTTNVSVTAP
ncbi:type IV pilus modification protein PilV [Halopseudomonas maritima]|uniref:type IV pilus modification protein PilV n=1 Tax=Halopseudomonas maritima TaxID=2918528 RepID=UPI001EE9B491|nr:type IV pilus modification protein PilV [Halopseudomonas maritima]